METRVYDFRGMATEGVTLILFYVETFQIFGDYRSCFAQNANAKVRYLG